MYVSCTQAVLKQLVPRLMLSPGFGLPAPVGLAAPARARAPTSTVPTPRRLPVEISDLYKGT